ncbi:hypothetical protein ACH42_14155 [Endozoicomonas sp. (ex Bugula neritina AB1)]|nr:hypothetical protein ACH42_14155 [Endozoicomonas sp. (ex Bugula neritina AB1)]
MESKNPTTKRVIAVAGCKGGVGKTLIAVNLALALAERGERVMIMDGNMAVPDVGISLGLDKHLDVSALSPDMEDMDSLLLSGPQGVKILTPANDDGWRDSIQVGDTVQLINRMDKLAPSLDTLIIDTAPGLAPDNVTLIQAAAEVLIVLNQEVVSLLDAAKLIRTLYRVFNVHRFCVVANAVSSRRCGAKQFEKLLDQLNDENQVVLSYLGAIPFDKVVSEALTQQTALLRMNNHCRAAKAFHRLGNLVSAMPIPEPRGRIEFFMPTRIRERV